MGKRNRKRQRTAGGTRGAEELILAAARAWGVDQRRYMASLERLQAHGNGALAAIDRMLHARLDVLWGRGWTPTDLVHVTGKRLSGAHAEHVAGAVIADGRARTERGQWLHPRWQAQLHALPQAGRPRLAPDLGVAVEALALLTRLPDLPPVLPPPGSRAARLLDGAAGLDQRTLARVRALLAKAESTDFAEEAEALTAKAQELITRHAIDEALLHRTDDVGEPSVRRIPLDDPYADAKAALYAQIAAANRCRVVHMPDFGWVTVFGYEPDLDAVEVLAASLLTQATGAMVRHGPYRDPAGRSRTRSFRRSFLFGFAHRIGQRLREATEEQVAAAGDADRLLPVLSARDDRVQAALEEMFPRVTRQSTSLSNAGGWAAGQEAADAADLGLHARLRSERTRPAIDHIAGTG